MPSTPDFYPSLLPPLMLFLHFHPSFTFGTGRPRLSDVVRGGGVLSPEVTAAIFP